MADPCPAMGPGNVGPHIDPYTGHWMAGNVHTLTTEWPAECPGNEVSSELIAILSHNMDLQNDQHQAGRSLLKEAVRTFLEAFGILYKQATMLLTGLMHTKRFLRAVHFRSTQTRI